MKLDIYTAKKEHQVAIDSAVNNFSELNIIANEIIKCLKIGGKVLAAGNGGSCADAQHFVGELVGRFQLERDGLAAICLGVNSVTTTAISNDYSFEDSLSREGTSLANSEDVFILFSSSGNSKNLISLATKAKNIGIKVFCLLGKGGGDLKKIATNSVTIASQSTPRVQEAHIFMIHLICQLIDEAFKSV